MVLRIGWIERECCSWQYIEKKLCLLKSEGHWGVLGVRESRRIVTSKHLGGGKTERLLH